MDMQARVTLREQAEEHPMESAVPFLMGRWFVCSRLPNAHRQSRCGCSIQSILAGVAAAETQLLIRGALCC